MWRAIEKALIEYFESVGAEFLFDKGDTFIGVVISTDDGEILYNDMMLSKLAEYLASCIQNEQAKSSAASAP